MSVDNDEHLYRLPHLCAGAKVSRGTLLGWVKREDNIIFADLDQKETSGRGGAIIFSRRQAIQTGLVAEGQRLGMPVALAAKVAAGFAYVGRSEIGPLPGFVPGELLKGGRRTYLVHFEGSETASVLAGLSDLELAAAAGEQGVSALNAFHVINVNAVVQHMDVALEANVGPHSHDVGGLA